ncbi:MAG: hypothetical protein HY681_04715 [Chloroflexi bacterium]|nr:hypothetical protein [Chloroflexota bacterium]
MSTSRERGVPWWMGPPDTTLDEQSALSILHLIENHTLDAATAALLWLFVERNASLIVAAPPRLAGKTTMLTALLGLRRPEVGLVLTRGQWEDFAFLKETEPSKTWVLCNEISPHLPMYLWGENVLTLFQSLDRGYSLGATMHADSPQEVIGDLRHPDVAVLDALLRHLALVVNLHAGYARSGVLRRLRDVWMQPVARPGGAIAFRRIARWQPGGDSFLLDLSPASAAAIQERLAFQGDLDAEVQRHATVLGRWLAEGVRSYTDVRRKAAEFYEARG